MTTKYLCHLSGHQFCDDNGDPLGSGTIETYVAGTSTNKATYKDNAGAASHANPIVLGADGRVPGDALWLDNDQGYKFVVKNSAGTTIWTHDDIEPIVPAATATQSEWVNGPTPTFISATSFSVGGDYTSTLQVGRRLKLTDSSTLYATISASSYSAGSDITTITVVVDGGSSVTSSLASFQYGVLAAENQSIPAPGQRDVFDSMSDAAATLTVGSPRTGSMTPTATRTITLPTTGVKAGEAWTRTNLASAKMLLVESSGGNHVGVIFPGMTETFRATQDTPTTAAHWHWEGKGPRILHTDTTEVGNTGSGEDDLMTYTLPGGALAANGDTVRAEMWFKGNGADNVTIKAHFGATADTIFFGATVTTTGAARQIEIRVTRTGAATQVERIWYGSAETAASGAATDSEPTETLSGDVVIKATGENTTDASDNAVVQTYLQVTYYPAA